MVSCNYDFPHTISVLRFRRRQLVVYFVMAVSLEKIGNGMLETASESVNTGLSQNSISQG